MPNGQDSNDLSSLGKLVDDSIYADPKRPEPAKPTPKRMTGFWFSLEKAEGLAHGIGQWPVKLEDLPTSPADELDSAHLLRAAAVELLT
jgi:hypothetical protein